MSKILLVIFAIIVGVIVATGWVLGAIRRMLGIPTDKKSGFNFQTNFRSRGGFGRKAQQTQEDVIYKSDEVVVLKGDAPAPSQSTKISDSVNKLDEGEIRDVDFTDKGD